MACLETLVRTATNYYLFSLAISDTITLVLGTTRMDVSETLC